MRWSTGRCGPSRSPRRARSPLTRVNPELKWPNDLMVGERKLAGVLAEGVIDPDDPLSLSGVVVGIGLNVGWAEPPPEVAARAITIEELVVALDRRVLWADARRPGAALGAVDQRPDELQAGTALVWARSAGGCGSSWGTGSSRVPRST